MQETHPDCIEISAMRLICPPANICEHIEVEVLQGVYGRKTSIHLLAGQAPSLSTDLSRSRVILSNQHEKRSYIVQRMAGGQSLLLPAEAEAFLFASLLEGEDIRIAVGYQRKELPSDPFIRTNLMNLGCVVN